jgi:hypothetical protein
MNKLYLVFINILILFTIVSYFDYNTNDVYSININNRSELSENMDYFDFKNEINNGDTIKTKYNNKELVLIDLQSYEGPLTMQLLPYGGIQSVYNYNLIIHFKNGYYKPNKIVYDGLEMSVKEFIVNNENLVNYVLG